MCSGGCPVIPLQLMLFPLVRTRGEGSTIRVLYVMVLTRQRRGLSSILTPPLPMVVSEAKLSVSRYCTFVITSAKCCREREKINHYVFNYFLEQCIYSTRTHPLTHSHTHSTTDPPTHSLTHSLTHTHTHTPTHSLTHSLTHAHTHSLTSPTHSLTHSPTHTLTHAHTHSLTHQLNSLTHPLTHSLTHLPSHSLTYPLTHPLTQYLYHEEDHSIVPSNVPELAKVLEPSQQGVRDIMKMEIPSYYRDVA